MEPPRPAGWRRRLPWLSVGLAVGLAVGFGVPSLQGALHASGAPATPAFPLWCSDPNPQAGWSYFAVYSTSNGTVSSFAGMSQPVPQNAGPGAAVVWIGTGSFSNLTLLHSMFCYVGEGHTGAWPFHVDLSTGDVVWG